jgi:4-diphosphocytidyl-2-C-methyl-D-erythritol kinase
MNLLKYFAYSKINFGLQVLNKRLDGFHNINTVFYLINLYDEMEFSESDTIEIISKPEFNIPTEDNLIYKAGKLFLESNKIKKGFKVEVKKNIPSGGGLGGGSSDAAFTLIALNRLFDTGLSHNVLVHLASKIGSDCAFFINGHRSAIGKSRGELLTNISFLLNYKIAIVNPGIHISTPLAYKLLNRDEKPIQELDFKEILKNNQDNPIYFRDKIFNDFEDVIFPLNPEIENIKNKLYALGAEFALMSGSGSTVFGIFPEEFTYKELKSHFPDYFCFISE